MPPRVKVESKKAKEDKARAEERGAAEPVKELPNITKEQRWKLMEDDGHILFDDMPVKGNEETFQAPKGKWRTWCCNLCKQDWIKADPEARTKIKPDDYEDVERARELEPVEDVPDEHRRGRQVAARPADGKEARTSRER